MFPYSYLYRTSYTVASLILALVGINLYIHKATFLSLVKTARSTAASFQVFLCQYVKKLTVWNVIDVLHVARYILLFCRAVAIAVSQLLFSLLGLPCHSSLLSAIFNFSCHFYCHAIFIAAIHLLDLSFVELPFLLWSCRRHSFCSGSVIAIHLLLKTTRFYSSEHAHDVVKVTKEFLKYFS